jgi:hypothetical protein
LIEDYAEKLNLKAIKEIEKRKSVLVMLLTKLNLYQLILVEYKAKEKKS